MPSVAADPRLDKWRREVSEKIRQKRDDERAEEAQRRREDEWAIERDRVRRILAKEVLNTKVVKAPARGQETTWYGGGGTYSGDRWAGVAEWVIDLDGEAEEARPKPENKIKATIHRENHMPVAWMVEAAERAANSEFAITVQLESEGVVVVGKNGDEYDDHTLPWTMMDKAEVNPIILAIETVEKHLATLGRLQAMVK